jgi:hypothetical protein
VHVPARSGHTEPLETEQAPALVGSRLRETGRPELATASAAYGSPPATATAGGVERKTID